MLLAVAVLRYDTASIKFCKKKKKEKRNEELKGLKVSFTFVRVAQNSRHLIQFYYFHFFFFLLFRCLSLFRETPRFLYPVHVIGPKIVVQSLSKDKCHNGPITALGKEWCGKRAGIRTEQREDNFLPRYPPSQIACVLF